MSAIGSELVSSYKQLLKALVRSGKRTRVLQANEDIKKKIALVTYEKIQLAREQAQVKGSNENINLTTRMMKLNKELEQLKNSDPSKSKKFLFYPRAREFRETLLEQHASGETLQRRSQHMKDIAAFLVNQMEYDELVERYNPGMKMSQEEKVKRTAARVGLQVPKAEQ
ncbi:HDL210Wp [Eremothecium sinecaudum]|uniref:HDL210Wp n=1 Tax=Eremothecium sinecaudum TaxID=45286 RepID=A0A0X8HS88_9SACH|nr:HDL210Wp [Eremothecium sinecaudum]AMD20534.1 HDL210Wp [Eremothecium sinecaudum]